MGASRKLQGEIDRVLKKVQEGVDVFDGIWNKVYDTDNANQKEKFEADLKKEIKKLQRYRDQIKTWIQSSEIKDKKALVDARKLIEREMERFKICEKETKTKAFSKEGLGQQPKTDPKEKAKSETRDWLNTVVGELESQIDNFEVEMEGLSVKKGKTRPPRLTHLETSIARHKSHIMKLELILRLLDNDELSPEDVNDVKDFLEDYVERNQEDFEEFSDVDEFYSTLPLDKVEALEDLVTMGQPGLAKGGGGGASSVPNSKTSLNAPSSLATVTVTPSHLSPPIQEPEETNYQDSNSDAVPKTPPSKISILSSSNSSNLPASQTVISNSSTHLSAAPSVSVPETACILESGPPTSPPTIPNVTKEEDAVNFPGRRSSPALTETTALTRGIGRGGLSTQPAVSVPLSPVSTVQSSSMTLGAAPLASEVAKRNILLSDESLANNVASGKAFSSSMVPGIQWRPGSSFQSQNDVGQLRGRTEIAPDQKEKFLQRLQQLQQQSHNNLLGMTNLAGGNSKPFSGQQQNPLLHQLSSQSTSITSQASLGMGLQSLGLSTASSAPVQPQSISFHQQAIQQGSILLAQKDSGMHNDGGLAVNEDQQQQLLSEDLAVEMSPGSSFSKNLMNDDDLKAPYVKDVSAGGASGPLADSAQLMRDSDLSLSQPLQSSQAGGSHGVIGQRNVSELGTIGDGIIGTPNAGGVHDNYYILQMLKAASFKLPQPKDSERAKSYTPRHPASTPPSFPQVQAPIVNNPAFWDRLGLDPVGTDALFFAFYYQPNTYQQYLAAKELKKNSWRFHRKFHTWFQRHEEPKVATDECEKGTYVYFDFHVANDDPNQGWCQRIKTDFTFEYSYLEDELIV